MTISFRCSKCGNSLKARKAWQGKSLQCPICGRPASVPQAAYRANPQAADLRRNSELALDLQAPSLNGYGQEQVRWDSSVNSDKQIRNQRSTDHTEPTKAGLLLVLNAPLGRHESPRWVPLLSGFVVAVFALLDNEEPIRDPLPI